MLESRSDDSVSQSFFGRIWWTEGTGSFDLFYGYIDSSFGGPWTLPADEALIYLRQGNEPSIIFGASDWEANSYTFSGDYDFEVNFASVNPVPEPSGLLALGGGLLGLVAVVRRRLA